MSVRTVGVGFLPDTPVGCVGVAVTARGLASCTMQPTRCAAADELQRRFAEVGGVRPDPEGCADALAQIREYLAGTRRRFRVRRDWGLARTEFQRTVWQTLARVPYGTVVTYGELAAQCGRPGAARAIGNAMNANPIAIVVPCHRVIAAGGKLGGFGGGEDCKRTLLALEGVELETGHPGQHAFAF